VQALKDELNRPSTSSLCKIEKMFFRTFYRTEIDNFPYAIAQGSFRLNTEAVVVLLNTYR
jgi:hypothetical protein